MTAHSKHIDSDRLVRLSEEVARIAGNLAELSMGAEYASADSVSSRGAASNPETQVSLPTVRWLITARRKRSRYLSEDLFADPAWDILLDLLHAELSQHRVAVSSLCIAANVPPTTGLRWINNMVSHGLLIRLPDTHDARRVFIELAPDVSAALRKYFAEVVEPGRIAA